MRDWPSTLGKNVRRLRLQKGPTQEQLAFEAEIDLTYVGGIERGKRNPSLLVMARIAKALSVPLPRLLGEKSVSRPNLGRSSHNRFAGLAPFFCYPKIPMALMSPAASIFASGSDGFAALFIGRV